MKILKKILWAVIIAILLPVLYMIISLILSSITIDRIAEATISDTPIYLNTNGVHLDIIIPIKNMDKELLKGLYYEENDNYLSFGWGDENFYLNTPTWGDLTISTAFNALFLQSTSLMHLSRHSLIGRDWVEVEVNEAELHSINQYLLNTFQTDSIGNKIMLANRGLTSTDDFYRSKGSYSWYNTCNSWVNNGFKRSGLKSCLWTPFDFGLMNKYE